MTANMLFKELEPTLALLFIPGSCSTFWSMCSFFTVSHHNAREIVNEINLNKHVAKNCLNSVEFCASYPQMLKFSYSDSLVHWILTQIQIRGQAERHHCFQHCYTIFYAEAFSPLAVETTAYMCMSRASLCLTGKVTNIPSVTT